MSDNAEDLGITRQSVPIEMQLFLRAKARMARQRFRSFGAYCVALIESDINAGESAPKATPPKEQDSILAGLTAEQRASVVALVEMLTTEVPEDLSDVKGAVIRFLHIWQSRTAKSKAGLRKQHG